VVYVAAGDRAKAQDAVRRAGRRRRDGAGPRESDGGGGPMRARAWIVRGTMACALFASCGVPPMISDTGYVGTWKRGNDRSVSIVAIAHREGQWLFRWTKRSFDGKYAILCDWHGRCEETLNGQLVATYAIATRFDEATGKLFTDTVEDRTIPE